MGTRERGGALTLARQWAMLRCIPRHPQRVTAGELRDRLRDRGFEVTSRTIERDLHTLSDEFPLVVDARAKPFGWSWAKGAAMEFAPGFTPAQAVAVLLAGTHLDTLLPRPMQKELLPLITVAGRTLKDSGWRDWHLRTAVLPTTLRLQAPRIEAASLAAVHGALGRRRCLEGQYRPKGAPHAKPMVIHPLGLLVRGAVQYLVCTLFDYSDIRQLAVHRLGGLRELDLPCRVPPGFCFQSYVRGVGATYEPRGMVRLVARFEREAAEHLSETPLTADQSWSVLGDGRVEIVAEVQLDETLRWWLLGFGSHVEVIEPRELRQLLAEEFERGASRYRQSGQAAPAAPRVGYRDLVPAEP